MYKKILFAAIFILTIIGFTACEKSEDLLDDTEDAEEIVIVDDSDNHDDAEDYIWDSSEEIQIILNGSTITVNGTGATAEESTVTITSAGTYSLTGTLDDGQIIVNTEDEEIVRLILNGAGLNCSTNAPIYVLSAEKAMIVLADNSENYVTDGTSYIFENPEDDEPNAAIYSKSDLTIYGNGTLTVEGNYNDGITSKDGLIITSGTININSVDDGIRGKDYLIVKDGSITVEAAGVGIKSDNEDDTSKGYITIEKGEINITAGGEAIEAEKDVEIVLGEIVLSSGGKGINGTIGVFIDDGNFTISSVDDAIHSNGFITINDGSFVISSDDDAIHADYDLVINDGDINITNSYEGIESAEGDITINGGEIHIVSSDDGINSAANGNNYIYINGGYIVIDAEADCFDSNGSMEISGGTVFVSSSGVRGGTIVDCDSYTLDGGFMVGLSASSRHTAYPNTSSDQYSLVIDFSSSQQAGTLIHIQDSDGVDILTYEPTKEYEAFIFSSSDFISGSTYDVYLGGSSSGTATDGLYMDGTYTAGSKYASFTITSTVTIVN
ncbi:MAG: carbohydrate-binding domain-containing protein [Bacteroidetes bacterium]|jgi:hypothetical protein|nr:carbohydrate-binding domain-containing protein [Bacteroidota bacterium]MBT6687128.1 carbohydrate-binding domain-containing protein [Bacteroidota bacterium]MBT7145141.1 carbohydrate-binding domain-containing protein [Bacteroidota bacterium]MBT7491926.1 carbohydrate-binding domain-containing protein [Bacteroidota bacterium]